MVVLNLLGKIQPICISKKLKLYIANLPKGEINNWNAHLVEEMETALKYSAIYVDRFQDKYGNIKRIDIKKLFKLKYPQIFQETMTEKDCAQYFADEMIYLYFDHNYGEIPTGDWTTNCFDGRFCEGDYTIKIIDLLNFLCCEEIHNKFSEIPSNIPHCIYCSDNNEHITNNHLIFSGNRNIQESIDNLVQIGKLLDDFLVNENDFYWFDYLCSELYRSKNDLTPNQCQKLYSLCEFFLEKDQDKELDDKLPQFINDKYSILDRKKMAEIIRQIRNKVAHGDFAKFREKVEEYAVQIMEKNGYWFDYSEYSRQNWAIMNICCNLLEVIKSLIATALTNKSYIETLKKTKI